ncbi:hypothetical protein VB780_15380 [Leptolyngbya sp. CCNP1308]|uniref:hypothetical protein n=1 Tax=Leptolyngbya sp. CCNP1308 TaxID=3110255 RepID=UPI002B1FCB7C|nr:hypothetical protein [Leptolyngbya sp. CCNP1308]MEA5449961.1 hypothetical protein [Leptolyngbya sp. CCNP1308]
MDNSLSPTMYASLPEQLHPDNQALRRENQRLQAENNALRQENQRLQQIIHALEQMVRRYA